MKAYVVSAHRSDYGEVSWPIKVFLDEGKAREHVAKAKQHVRDYSDLATATQPELLNLSGTRLRYRGHTETDYKKFAAHFEDWEQFAAKERDKIIQKHANDAQLAALNFLIELESDFLQCRTVLPKVGELRFDCQEVDLED